MAKLRFLLALSPYYPINFEDGLNDALLGRQQRVWTAGVGYAAGYRAGSRRLLKATPSGLLAGSQ